MFEQTFVNVNAQTRKPWTVTGSLLLQAIGVCVLLIAPLLHIAAIRPVLQGPVTMRLIKTEPPPARQATSNAPVTRVRRSFSVALLSPRTVPAHIDMTPDAPPAVEITSIPSGTASLLSGLPAVDIAPPAPQKLPVQTPSTRPLTVSSGVQNARLIFGPKPAYPAIARAARVAGTVRLRALIARDGSVENLQLISGPPLLVSSAMQAIGQWKYQPTVLNSEPVAVETEIAVTFTLQ